MAGACADFSARLRRHTYPPDFNYITEEQLHSAMWRLAQSMRDLDGRMRGHPVPGARDGDALDARDRAEVDRLLVSMEQAARGLGADWRPSNHPKIETNLPMLQRDIKLALDGVRREPPNYEIARSLPGACVYCHGAK